MTENNPDIFPCPEEFCRAKIDVNKLDSGKRPDGCVGGELCAWDSLKRSRKKADFFIWRWLRNALGETDN